jgi:acyl-CoA synthetase (AMP-forming)/AMP-acid ligase II
VRLGHLVSGTSLGGRAAELAGRSVLIATRDPFDTALALIELDGMARRLIVCTPDLSSADLSAVVAKAEVDAIVSDAKVRSLKPEVRSLNDDVRRQAFSATEWVLLTSGTTGAPKLIVHSFASLTAPISNPGGADMVWGTFYDIRRYGGLQIFLRTILGRGSLVVCGAGESVGEYLVRLAAHGATHVSGTPSHWRRALMSPAARAITPRYVRLSGKSPTRDSERARAFIRRPASARRSPRRKPTWASRRRPEGFPARIVGSPATCRSGWTMDRCGSVPRGTRSAPSVRNT